MYTPFKYSNAKIQLSSENLQHAYEKSNTTENSGILHCCGYWVFCHYWNAFFFPPSISFFFFFFISSSFFLLCPGSLHKLSALMVYSFYSTFGLLSVHVVCLYASQLFSARDLPHGFICYGECFLPYQWTTSPGKRSIFFSTSVNFFFFFLNRKLNQKKIDCPSLPITLQNTAILQIIAEFKLQNDWYSLFIWLCMFILWMGKGDWVLWFNCDFLQHVSWQAEQHCYISNFWIKTCKAVSCLW